MSKLMSEETLLGHGVGNFLYMFDLRRIASSFSASGAAYEFVYDIASADVHARKKCLFGEKKR